MKAEAATTMSGRSQQCKHGEQRPPLAATTHCCTLSLSLPFSDVNTGTMEQTNHKLTVRNTESKAAVKSSNASSEEMENKSQTLTSFFISVQRDILSLHVSSLVQSEPTDEPSGCRGAELQTRDANVTIDTAHRPNCS